MTDEEIKFAIKTIYREVAQHTAKRVGHRLAKKAMQRLTESIDRNKGSLEDMKTDLYQRATASRSDNLAWSMFGEVIVHFVQVRDKLDKKRAIQ
jgi:hypothetical protein